MRYRARNSIRLSRPSPPYVVSDCHPRSMSSTLMTKLTALAYSFRSPAMHGIDKDHTSSPVFLDGKLRGIMPCSACLFIALSYRLWHHMSYRNIHIHVTLTALPTLTKVELELHLALVLAVKTNQRPRPSTISLVASANLPKRAPTLLRSYRWS